jgi:diaminohydroxyphosphoribosylaminopyrimidine deaminase/5-amino-6-(5-phosphoribosylamino)uracil reductase
MTDPNPQVSGRGVAALKRAGIKVEVGLERAAAENLNRSYLTWRRKGRPYVILKMAETLDGKIATSSGQSRWISSPASRRLVHQLRAESDAVAVGARTATLDNPKLTSHGAGRDPLRVVIDPRLSTPPSLSLYRRPAGKTLVICGPTASAAKRRRLERQGVKILRTNLKFNDQLIKESLRSLAQINISQLLLEGGGETAWSFIRAGAVDEIYFFVAPILLGGRSAPTPVEGKGFQKIQQAVRLKSNSVSRIGSDILIHGRIEGRS